MVVFSQAVVIILTLMTLWSAASAMTMPPPPSSSHHQQRAAHHQHHHPPLPPPTLALKDGDAVMCGGVRSWTCDVNNDRSMVPTEQYKPVPKRFLPDGFQENWFGPPYIHSEPENPARFQRELYLKAEHLANDLAKQSKFTTVANAMESAASELKFHTIFRNPLAAAKFQQTTSIVIDRPSSSAGNVHVNCTGGADDPCVVVATGGGGGDALATHDVVIASDNLLEIAKNPEAVLDFLLQITRVYLVLAIESRDVGLARPMYEFFRRQWHVNEMEQYLESKNATILAVHQGTKEKSSYWIVASPPARVPAGSGPSSSSSSSYYMQDTKMTSAEYADE